MERVDEKPSRLCRRRLLEVRTDDLQITARAKPDEGVARSSPWMTAAGGCLHAEQFAQCLDGLVDVRGCIDQMIDLAQGNEHSISSCRSRHLHPSRGESRLLWCAAVADEVRHSPRDSQAPGQLRRRRLVLLCRRARLFDEETIAAQRSDCNGAIRRSTLLKVSSIHLPARPEETELYSACGSERDAR